MKRTLVSLTLLCALSLLWPMAATAITLTTVPVGNPGNAADSANSGSVPGIGSVSYNYSIGQYDVTVGQYTAFLNAVAGTDPYHLYNSSMASDLNIAGISRSGSSGSYSYSVVGSANHPITYVSWGDAARFANWLANGQPIGGETLSTTEDGSYYLNGATTTTLLNGVTRNANASWVIPTENEWYKAAYYNPGNSSYYQYPFSSSMMPTSAPPGSTANAGNIYGAGYAVTGSPGLSSTQNYLTDVGAYTASASPYGAFDMGGDVFQWNDALISGGRGLRGGSWTGYFGYLASSYRTSLTPISENNFFGFRLVTLGTSVVPFLRGDMNFDGHVNAADISAMELALTNLNAYLSTNFGGGTPSSYGVTATNVGSYADVYGGTKFDNSDLEALLLDLNGGHGSAESVPEPSTAVLASIACGLIWLLCAR